MGNKQSGKGDGVLSAHTLVNRARDLSVTNAVMLTAHSDINISAILGGGKLHISFGTAYAMKRFHINGTSEQDLFIYDVAGQKENLMLYGQAADVAIVMYDMEKRETFERAKELVEELRQQGRREIVVCLISNELEANCHDRAVSPEEVELFIKERGILIHGEVSIQTGHNVVKVFVEIVRALIAVQSYIKNGQNLPNESVRFPSSFVKVDKTLNITALGFRERYYEDTNSVRVNAPREISWRGPEALAAYIEASRDGTQEIHRTRLMLVGQERVGKTSLMNMLIGQMHNPSENITDGLDATKVCRVPFNSPNESWQLQNTDKREYARRLQETFKEEMVSKMAKQLLDEDRSMEEENQIEKEEDVVDKGEKAANTVAKEENELTIETIDDDDDKEIQPTEQLEFPEPNTSSTSSNLEDNKQREVQVPSDIASALEKYEKSSLDKGTDDLEIAFWDFAGQDLYYTTHQVFLNRRAIFVLVFNMSCSLLEPCQVEDFSLSEQEGKTKSRSRYHDLNGLEFLNFWLQSIYTYAAPSEADQFQSRQPCSYKSPPIVIIGTHRGVNRKKDKASRQDEKCVKQQIFDMIAGKPYEMHIIRQIHFVENDPSLRNQEDEEVIKALQKQLAEIATSEPYMKDQVPLRWLQFQQAVVETAADNTYYMTFTETKQLAAKFGILENIELLTMLHLYHDLGTIVYFGGDETEQEKMLKDIVILDPQWLIDVFKRVITVLPDEKQWATYSAMWHRLQKEGILEDALIDHVWKDLLHLKPQLLDLMEMFDLLFATSNEEGDEHKPIYYVPGCLQPPSMEANQRSQDITDGTFYVNCGEFLPEGIFHRVLVHTARWTWKNTGKSPKLYYHFGTFTVGPGDNIHTFQLQMRSTKPACIKVAVKKPAVFGAASVNKPSIEVCTEVLRFMEKTMSNLKCRWAKGFQYEMSVCCMACKERRETSGDSECELHLIPLAECYYSEFVYCERGEKQIPTKLYREQLQPVSDDEAALTKQLSTDGKDEIQDNDEASKSDFNDVIRLSGPDELQNLYSALDIPDHEVQKAEKGADTKNVDCQAMAVFRWWKRVKGKKATRHVILEALVRCENINAKQELEDKWMKKYSGHV